jgi:hypothetical protein
MKAPWDAGAKRRVSQAQGIGPHLHELFNKVSQYFIACHSVQLMVIFVIRKVKMPSQDNPTNTMPPVMPTSQSSKPSGTKIKKPTDPVATSPVVVRPDDQPKKPASGKSGQDDSRSSSEPKFTDPTRILSEIASRISESHNILVTLSADPSVDEISAAIGLTLYLDRIGKRVTAIYSGITPNALEFLKPEDTFEQKADMLQDFVIAINKDKADHLRYKLDGDYVKIFITPYRSSISSDDLEFTYGDFNIDLVIALDVSNVSDLAAALREHGRIVHDAPVINFKNNCSCCKAYSD